LDDLKARLEEHGYKVEAHEKPDGTREYRVKVEGCPGNGDVAIIPR
jgi:hypothetical protein